MGRLRQYKPGWLMIIGRYKQKSLVINQLTQGFEAVPASLFIYACEPN